VEATATGVNIVVPDNGREGFLGSIGVRFMIDGPEAAERFSLVEHPMSPRALAAPLHLHTREDEYSFVLEGRMGALLGDDVVEAGPGELNVRYGLEMQPESVPELLERFGLRIGEPLSGGWTP
jgi:mannose-6-phosphate isomerase-like protein (cupin superfamily)